MEFIEERLLDKVAYGTQSGLEYNTRIVTLRSGVERRARLWTRPLTRFTVIYNVLKPIHREDVVRAFRAAGGRFLAFRIRDPLDYTAEQEPLTTSTGVEQTVQLSKSYTFGPIVDVGPIYKPVAGTVVLYADGEEIPSTVDTTTGLVTFITAADTEITWSGQFDKPVRFDDDNMMWSLDAQAGTSGQRIASTDITLTEIRL